MSGTPGTWPATWRSRCAAWCRALAPRRGRRLTIGTAAPLAVAALAAVLLTTFAGPEGDEGDLAAVDTTAPSSPGELAAPPVPAPQPPDVSSVEVTLDLDQVGAEAPAIPAISDDERGLTAFRSAAVPEDGAGAVVPADLVARAPDGEAFDLEGLDGPLTGARHVAAAASIDGEAAAAAGVDDDARAVTVLGVDAASFRPLTPEVTATSDAVWERLGDGDALVQHDVARELGLDLGDPLLLTTEDGVTVTLRVGALAANGTPPLADILVSTRVVRDLGRDAPDTLVVAVDGELDPVVDALTDATGANVTVRRPPPEPVGPPQRQGTSPSGAIEPFTYTSRADGRIDIHGDWVARNIVPIDLPRMPSARCHRVMVPQLYAAVDELIARGLYDHLDPSQFAGCFMARHIDWSPARPLSMHAWGLAIDFNSRDNALGARPVMDPQVVEVFRRWGFKWGGDWRRPDGMHFELERIVSTG